jgi:hypothetical protein
MTTKSKVLLFGVIGAFVLTAAGIGLASAYGGGYGYGMMGSGYGYNRSYDRPSNSGVQPGNNYGGGWEMGPGMMRGYGGGYGCW